MFGSKGSTAPNGKAAIALPIFATLLTLSLGGAVQADIVTKREPVVMDRSHLTEPRHMRALSDGKPGSGQIASGTVVVQFNPLEPVPLILRRGEPTKIIFPPWDEIGSVLLPPESDYRVQQDPSDLNALLVTPDISTLEEGTLHVTGAIESGRSIAKFNHYTFLLRPVDYKYPDDPDMMVIVKDRVPPKLAGKFKAQHSPDDMAKQMEARQPASGAQAEALDRQADTRSALATRSETPTGRRPSQRSSQMSTDQAPQTSTARMSVRQLIEKIAQEKPEVLQQALDQAGHGAQEGFSDQQPLPARRSERMSEDVQDKLQEEVERLQRQAERAQRQSANSQRPLATSDTQPTDMQPSDMQPTDMQPTDMQPTGRQMPLADTFRVTKAAASDEDVFAMLEAEQNQYNSYKDENLFTLVNRWAEKGGLPEPLYFVPFDKIIGTDQTFDGPALRAFETLAPALTSGADPVGYAVDQIGTVCFYPLVPTRSELEGTLQENPCESTTEQPVMVRNGQSLAKEADQW